MDVSRNNSLGETIHAFLHFNHDKSIAHKCEEVVLVNNLLGKRGGGNTHIFVFHHRRPQVKILQVHHLIAGCGAGDGGVDVNFDSGDVGYVSSDGVIIDDVIVTDGPADAFCFIFWDDWHRKCTYMSLSCWIFFEVGYEADVIGTMRYSCSYSLYQLSYFAGVIGVPLFALDTVEQGW